MDKFEYINELLPFYEELLTDRQREIVQYYYYEDLSLSEISEILKISRNAVYDTLKKVEKSLEEYEAKLRLSTDYQQRMLLYQKLKDSSDAEVNKIADELIKMED